MEIKPKQSSNITVDKMQLLSLQRVAKNDPVLFSNTNFQKDFIRTSEMEEAAKTETDSTKTPSTLESTTSTIIAEKNYDFSAINHDLDPTIIQKSGKSSKLSEITSSVILLYFSSGECPDCMHLDPQLFKFYNEINKYGTEKNLSIILVDKQKSQSIFNNYYNSLPWDAVAFDDINRSFLFDKYLIYKIPTLILVDHEGNKLATFDFIHEIKHRNGSFHHMYEHLKFTANNHKIHNHPKLQVQ